MTHNEEKKSLDDALKNLPREIEPEKDLWPGIEYAIGNNRHKRAYGLPQVAAVLLVGVFALSQWNGWVAKTESDSKYRDAVVEVAVIAMEQQHTAHKEALLSRYKDQTVLADDWHAHVDALTAARLALVEALERDPYNPYLISMLKRTYNQELQLIESVHINTPTVSRL